MYMIGAGRLHKAQRLSQQAMLLETELGAVLPEVGYPALFQAEILREWNRLDTALSQAQEAIALCKQGESIASLAFLLYGYAVLMRICLSRGDYSAAHSALQEVERIGMSMNQPTSLHVHSIFTTVDQVRLWLACGELDCAVRWAERLGVEERHGTPFAREREEVAYVRVLLATARQDLALERLESVLVRATTAQRWGHVIEVRLLQALAYHMHQEETLALSALSEAVRLAEPEGYICSFVDEGVLMVALLSQLREEQCEAGPTPYLDTLLAAFPRRGATHKPQLKRVTAQARASEWKCNSGDSYELQSKRVTEPIVAQLLDPLSERELEVLQLLARGASNQEIGRKLMIAVDTVKRHVSQIFSKLGVKNRLQAVRRARLLGLLAEEQ
jgi:LuxR family maltose regulon positive regulatory protein